MGVLFAPLCVGCGSEAKQEAAPAPEPSKPKVAKVAPKPEKVVELPPPPPPRPKTPASMDDAVAQAAEIHMEHRRTLLCGCRYAKSGRVSPASCGYRTRADEQLAKYVMWSHVVPPHDFGADRACWTKPMCTAEDGSKFRGIECCQQIDEEFATMRTDLHNLMPLVGEVGTDRSNYAFGDLKSESRFYGSCDLEIDRDAERIDPAPEVRGDIARVYHYMAATYPGTIHLSVEQRVMFQGWAADDPPDGWERKRAAAVVAIQGIAPTWLSEVPVDDPPEQVAGDADGADGVIATGSDGSGGDDGNSEEGSREPSPDASPSASTGGQAPSATAGDGTTAATG